MTALKRWGKGIVGGICFALGWWLVDKFFGSKYTSGGFVYFLIAWAIFMGWLGGSSDERKLRKPLITE
jgi:lipopolysaccharide export LptBFGC system permease protein LptF